MWLLSNLSINLLFGLAISVPYLFWWLIQLSSSFSWDISTQLQHVDEELKRLNNNTVLVYQYAYCETMFLAGIYYHNACCTQYTFVVELFLLSIILIWFIFSNLPDFSSLPSIEAHAFQLVLKGFIHSLQPETTV